MSSYFPTMKKKTRLNEDVKDAMHNVHGHAGNICRDVVLESIRKLIDSRSAYQKRQPVNIADFGAADGQASLSLINEVIDIVQRDLGKEQDIVVYYNDLPMSDFNLLSKVIQGTRRNSGRAVCDNVYSMMIPRCMYEQCLPNNSLDLAISTLATQYLSRKVCQIQNGVFMDEADDSEQIMMREQSKADWRAFVIARGRELIPGGFLITLSLSSNDSVASPAIHEGFPRLGRFVSDMAREGVITQEEYLATNCISNHLRTEPDFKEPFISAVPEVLELGLELVSTKAMTYDQQDPLYHISNKDETEKLAYSWKIVDMVYPWMYHVLYEGLSSSRTEDEKLAIIDQYFNRLQTYAFAHSNHKPCIHFTEVVIKKVCKTTKHMV